ncbi:MAG: hypothetical protein OEX02_02620 [Cyclobacteriaceae bacterium]|nr:hypothetical protein [Cyclobacteriaceae bacterium]
MAYIKEANCFLRKAKLFPLLSDVSCRLNDLLQVKNCSDNMTAHFTREIEAIDLVNKKLVYKEHVVQETIRTIKDTIRFAIPHFEKVKAEGEDLCQFVAENSLLEPIGMLPLYMNEGYLIINVANSRNANIYQYSLGLYHATLNKPSINLRLVERLYKPVVCTFESVKLTTIKRICKWPNPATFLFRTSIKFPYTETVVPVAREVLAQHVSNY